jgi:hypothetical protein
MVLNRSIHVVVTPNQAQCLLPTSGGYTNSSTRREQTTPGGSSGENHALPRVDNFFAQMIATAAFRI